MLFPFNGLPHKMQWINGKLILNLTDAEYQALLRNEKMEEARKMLNWGAERYKVNSR